MDMEIWLDSLGGAELLEAAQAETEPETEPEAQTMRAFSAQSLGATMSVSPVVPGANEAVAESMANEKKKNVIFFIEKTDELKEHFELAKDIIVRKGGSVEIMTFDYEIRDDSQEMKYDVSRNIYWYLNSDDYDINADTYIFLVFNEKKIFPDDSNETDEKDDFRASENSTAFALINKLDSLGDKKPNISVVYDSSSTNYDRTMFLGDIVKDTGGCEIDIKPLNSDRVAVARAIINKLDIQLTSVKYVSSVDLVPLPQNFDSIYIQNVYNTGIDKESPDYDNDGLLDYYEIAFFSGLIDFSKPEPFPTLAQCVSSKKLVYVEENMTRFTNKNKNVDLTKLFDETYVLPINSAPTLPDGDSDGYTDYDEIGIHNSNPLVRDVVEYGLANDYVKITDTPNKKTNAGYGGDQHWFEDYKDINSIQLTGGGCGATASGDILLYLQGNRILNSANDTSDDRVFTWNDYALFILDYSLNYVKPIDIYEVSDLIFSNYNFLYINFQFHSYLQGVDIEKVEKEFQRIATDGLYTWGIMPWTVKSGFNDYCTDNNIPYSMNYIHPSVDSKTEYENKLIEQLKQDIPAILLTSYPGENPVMYAVVYSDGTTSEYDNGIDYAHYMAITGIRIDKISGNTKLILSTDSKKIEIDFNDYLKIAELHKESYNPINYIYKESIFFISKKD
jgi:hypothetical protein